MNNKLITLRSFFLHGLFIVAIPAMAANVWVGSESADWNVAENWYQNVVPGLAAEAHLTATDKDYIVDYTNAMSATEIGTLVVSNAAPFMTTLNIDAPGFITRGVGTWMTLGDNGRIAVWTNGVMESRCTDNIGLTMSGQLVVNGGSVSLLSANSMRLVGTGAEITLNSGKLTTSASGGGNSDTKRLRIQSGAAINFHGGVADFTCNLQVGYTSSGSNHASFNMTDGTVILSRLRQTDFYSGYNNEAGTVIISGGSVTNFGSMVVGHDLYSKATGSMLLTGGSWEQLDGHDVLIGNIRGTGTVTVDGGVFKTTGNTVLGNRMHANSNPLGRLNLYSGTYTATNASGDATLTIRRGEAEISGGTLTVDKLVSDPDLYEGSSKFAVLTFLGGTLNVSSLTVSTTQPLRIGNGGDIAILNLGSGVHQFKEAVTFSDRALLSADGSIIFLSDLEFEAGSSLKLDGQDVNRSPIDVRGTLTIPSTMSVDLSLGESSHPEELVLFTYDTLSAPADLSGVSFSNPSNYKVVNDAINNRIVATYVPPGTTLIIQ